MNRSEIFTRPLPDVLLEADHDDLEFEPDARGRKHLDRWVRKRNPTFDPIFEDPAVDRMREVWKRNALLDEGADALFEIRAGVGDVEANGRVDVAKVETLFEAVGAFDLNSLDGPTGFFAANKGDAIRAFQRAKGLPENGAVNPRDATMRALKAAVQPKIRQAIKMQEERRQSAGLGSGSDGQQGSDGTGTGKPTGETDTAFHIRPTIPVSPPVVPPKLPLILGGRPPTPIDPNEPKRPVDPPKVHVGTTFPKIEEGKPQILIFPDISDEIGQIYIDKRNESKETRDEIDHIRDYFVKHRGWSHEGGGRIQKGKEKGKEISEDYIGGPGEPHLHPKTGKPGDKRPGHVRPDLTFKDQHGNTIYVQHVDVDKNGMPTQREIDSANRLLRARKGSVYMIPKQWQLRLLKNRTKR